MPGNSTSPAAAVDLAQRLADRLCHDVLSTSQGLVSAVDLLREAESAELRDEAIELIAEALASLRAKTTYARTAFGPGRAVNETSEIGDLAQGLFADLRPHLNWAVTPAQLGPAATGALLCLLQIIAEAAAGGGQVSVSGEMAGDMLALHVEAEGPRVTLREEARAGLSGEPPPAGPGGRWSQGAMVARLMTCAGGRVGIEVGEGRLVLSLSLPDAA